MTRTRVSKRSSKKKPARRRTAKAKLPPTLGPHICHWIQRSLVHTEGDYFGQLFKLRPSQKRFIWRAYEMEPDGSRRYNRALLGIAKGGGKTELGAAIACAELAGPVVFDGWDRPPKCRLAPIIPIGAASFEQADLAFGAARIMLREGRLASHFEIYDTEILLKDGPGRMYRVAAVAGTNDGARPTFFLADELHEWTGRKERVHLVLSNGRAKRQDAWELAISTAGWDVTSLLGRLYQHGKRIEAGEEEDPHFLFDWHEAMGEVKMGNRRSLERAAKQANPAVGDFLSLDAVLDRAREMPEFEWLRYHANQWVSAPDRWLPQGAWDGRSGKRKPPEDGAPIVIGFDGSYAGDSTAIVGASIEEVPRLFVIGAWEKSAGAGDDWRVDIPDVEQSIRNACGRWQVQRVGCDPFRWQRSIAVLAEAGFPVIEWPSHQPSRMVPACAQFYDAVVNEQLTHDGDERMAKHIANAIVKIDSRGPRITKDHKDSVRRIDLAVAAVIAHDLALRAQRSEGTWGLV